MLTSRARNNRAWPYISTAEAEYMALSSAAQEAVWMRELISDLRNPPATSTEILEDNQSAISMAKNPQFHGRTKHINIKYHFIREQIANGTICLKYCPTVADLLMKGIGPERLRMSYGMCKQESVRRSVEEVHSLIVYKHWNHT